jgi:hypothetical protein
MLLSLLEGLEEKERAPIISSTYMPRELALLRYYLNGGSREGLDDFCTNEGITRNYLYKLERSLIASVYDALKKSGYDVMDLLFQRRLYVNFIGFCKIEEERLLKKNIDKATLNYFYNRCYDYLIHFEQPENIDIPLIKEYGLKYSKTREVRVPDDRLQIAAVLLTLQLVLINSDKRLTLDKKRAKAEALLTKDQARYYRTKNVKAKYYYYIARSRYYSNYRADNLDAIIRFLGKAESIITTYPEQFTEGERVQFALRMGRVYLIYNQHEKSHEVYSKVYEGRENWKEFGIPNYLGYVRSLIQVDKYRVALRALERADDDIRLAKTKILEVALELLYAEVMLHTERYEKSSYHLNRAKKLMQGKVYYHSYDISLRVTETTLAFLMKRWDVADELIERNLKWFKDNKEDGENPSVIFLRFLRMLLERHFTGKEITKRYLTYLENERSPLRAFPKTILDRLIYISG